MCSSCLLPQTKKIFLTPCQILCNKGCLLLQLWFVFDPSSCTGLRVFVERKARLLQSHITLTRFVSGDRGGQVATLHCLVNGQAAASERVMSFYRGYVVVSTGCLRTTFGLSSRSWCIKSNSNIWR